MPKKYRVDELRENIYLLAIQMEENGNKEWANVLYQTRDILATIGEDEDEYRTK